MSSQHLLSTLPEQRDRRGRSRVVHPPLPILPPFPNNHAEKTKDASKHAKTLRWQEYILSAAEESGAEDSRNDEASPRIHADEMLHSRIAWEQQKSRTIASDNQHSDVVDTIPFDEQSFSDRKRPVRCAAVASSIANSSARDQYQLSRLQARLDQRKARYLGCREEKKFNPKRLRASRMQITRGLYNNSNQETANCEASRTVTTLSSYRGKCFDKMMHLLHEVAPPEEDIPLSVKDEGTIMSSNAGGKASLTDLITELKLIKKTIQSEKQAKDDNDEIDTDDQSVAFPEAIDQPYIDSIASKVSDVTSPTIQDGFELDEVLHYPREQLPSLEEVNENSDDLHTSAGDEESKSTGDIRMKEESLKLGSTSQSIHEIGKVDETKKVECFPHHGEDEVMTKEDQDNMFEEITSLLKEREAEIKAKAKEVKANEGQQRTEDKSREDDIDTNPLPRVKKVTFLEPALSLKEEPIPHSYCCIFM